MKEQKVEFKVGQDALRGSLFMPDGSGRFPAVIFFHGSGSKGEKYYEAAKLFPQQGIMALAFNFRGCGISDGNYLEQTHENALQDGKAAFDLLLSQSVDPDRIGVVGGSFGGYVATMLLPQLNVKSLVLLAPAAYDEPLSVNIERGGLTEEIAFFKDKSNWENSLSYKNIESFENPVLLIESGNDENVPHGVTDKYLQRAQRSSKKEIKIIAGADHRLSEPKWRDKFFDLILNWFLETL